MPLHLPHRAHTLDNGLRLFIHEDHRVPIVCVNVWYFVGSKNEHVGRTGFAHLFEHLMFEGSKHVPKGQFDELLETAGGTNNGSTSTDRTNYWETVPPGALDLALHLESDRMGWFLETITQQNLDAQRDVVKNERRQSYENRPYGLAYETMMASLYPETHPYHWPVIGWMRDLDAATLEDVRSFFQRYYSPRNATLAIAGDVDGDDVIERVEHYFGAIAPGSEPPRVHTEPVESSSAKIVTLEDDVYLSRTHIAWHSPALYSDGDAEMDVAAEILGSGKSSRLYKTLVHDLELAQDVEAYHNSGQLGSSLVLVATAREGVSTEQLENEVHRIVQETAKSVEVREVERGRNHIETATLDALQSVGGFGGKADRLNQYFFYTGVADYLETDLERYRALDPNRVSAELARVTAQQPVTVRVEPRR
ncbi:MAG TPA: pitrilysin family protein [Longimicrobiales bacterium]|nr:pitrilysin family protein [Longimicrobiales bacterium]